MWALGSVVERVPDGPEAGTYRIVNIMWVGGSVVERVPDKNEVKGSIPFRPTTKG